MTRREFLASLSPARRAEVLEVLLYRGNGENRSAIAEHVRRSGRVWVDGNGRRDR